MEQDPSSPKHDWLWPLLTETNYDEDGNIESIEVALRTGMAVRSVKPDPNRLIYYELGEDGFPVTIRYFEPAGDFWCPPDSTGWKKPPTGATENP